MTAKREADNDQCCIWYRDPTGAVTFTVMETYEEALMFAEGLGASGSASARAASRVLGIQHSNGVLVPVEAIPEPTPPPVREAKPHEAPPIVRTQKEIVDPFTGAVVRAWEAPDWVGQKGAR